MKTMPDRTEAILPANEASPQFPETSFTASLEFMQAMRFLSSKPLRRPARMKPRTAAELTPDNEVLRKLAAANPPHPEWYECDDEPPFAIEG